MPEDEKDRQQTSETEQPAVSPEGAALQAMTIAREKIAGAAMAGDGENLAVGEVETVSPEVIAQEISARQIEKIPEADRKISSPKQMDIVLSALRGTKDGEHLTSTKDKLGNLPTALYQSLGLGSGIEDRQTGAKVAKNFAENPLEVAATTDKVRRIALSDLPESVRQSILNIILVEGPKSAQQAFSELAKRIENNPDTKLIDIIGGLKKEDSFVSPEADNIRRHALKHFLEGIYPELMSSQEVALLEQIHAQPFEKRSDLETIISFAQKFEKVTGNTDFVKFSDADKLQLVFDEAEKKVLVENDEILKKGPPKNFKGTPEFWRANKIKYNVDRAVGLDGVLNRMQETIEAIIKNKFVNKT